MIYAGRDDLVTAAWYSYLRPNFTDTYTIRIWSDDGADLYIGGTQYQSRVYVGGGTFDYSLALTADTNYYMVIYWREVSGSAGISLSWSYTGQSMTTIPSDNWVYPLFADASPYTFNVLCPTGYTATDPTYTDQ